MKNGSARMGRVILALLLLFLATACNKSKFSDITPLPSVSALPRTGGTVTPTAPSPTVGLPQATPTVVNTVTPAQADLLGKLLDGASSARKLSVLSDVKQHIITPEQVPGYLATDLDKDDGPAQMARDQVLYTLLDQIKEGDDLRKIVLDLLSEQVVGFYRPDSKELFLVSGTGELDDLAKVTLVHEYTHALQDQHFDLGALTDRARKQGNSDQQAALQALYEGDASVAMTFYMLQSMTLPQMQAVVKKSSEADTTKLNKAPWMVRLSLLFPYQVGAQFITDLQRQGNWPAVDKAYANPPASTEQVMHSRKYQAGERPLDVRLPDVASGLGAGWTETAQDVLGEFGLYAYLSQFVDNTEASRAAEGWGGDRYVLLKQQSGGNAVAILTRWDTPQDASEFFAALLDYMAAKGGAKLAQDQPSRKLWSGANRSTLVSKQEGGVLLVIAGDEQTSAQIAAQFSGF